LRSCSRSHRSAALRFPARGCALRAPAADRPSGAAPAHVGRRDEPQPADRERIRDLPNVQAIEGDRRRDARLAAAEILTAPASAAIVAVRLR
jgi:hypothetical protein